ncbi:MAG: transposase, partial [Opitutaceae bacterium]
ETPRGNLSEGMRWLQATFASRFNRLRKESGRLFQGRFKSLAVEDLQRLSWLCHYIHLNPVRAKICRVEQLRDQRWSSYWYLRQRRRRPEFLCLQESLQEAGGLEDNRAGWNRYESYLSWLSEDAPARKQMEFARMSRGWAIGTKGFRQALVQDEKRLRAVVRSNQREARAARETAAEARLEQALDILGKGPEDIAADRKAALGKSPQQVCSSSDSRAPMPGWVSGWEWGSSMASAATWRR